MEKQVKMAVHAHAHSAHLEGDLLNQIEMVNEASSTGKDRAEFIANPSRYAQKRGITLDRKFEKIIRDELILVERYAAILGNNNKHLHKMSVELDPVVRRKGISSHPGASPVAALSAVQAASSVVQTAVSMKLAMQSP